MNRNSGNTGRRSLVRGVYLLLALGLVLSAGSVPVTQAASPIYVRSDGDNVNCNGTTNNAYSGSGGSGLDCAVKTIQKGIDLVDAGGTVNVAAGTYNENVTIIKSVTLVGSGAVNLAGTGDGLTVSAGTVSVRGFNISGFANGIRLTGGTLNASLNNLTGSTVGVRQEGGAATAENNWWGVNTAAGVAGKVSGSVDYDPWLVLNLGASPYSIEANGTSTSTVTADLTRNSAGADTSGSGYLPDGVSVAFTTGAGTLGSSNATTTNGQASTTLTSVSSSTQVVANVSATVNNATAYTSVFFQPTGGASVSNVAADQLGNGESVTLSGAATATYAGSSTPTVTLAQYASNPGGTVTGMLGAGSNFYDLHVANNTDASATLTVVFNANAVGDTLRYWDGSAWNTVVSNNGTIPTASGSPPQITVVFGPTSQPRLVDLTGTPIVSSSPEAIAVQFAQSQIVQGQQIAATIVVSSTNVYGVEVHLTFPANLLQVQSVTLGSDLVPDVVGQNTYSNSAGTIDFAFSQIAPRSAVAGNDIEVATIIFTASSSNTGTATVDYSSSQATIFSNPDGIALGRYVKSGSSNTLDAQTDSVTVVQGATIAGTVLLQGRTTYTGTIILAIPGTSLQATTGGTGAFSLTGLIPGGPDGVVGSGSTYEVSASFAGYLTARRTGYEPAAGSNALPTVTLKGGDATRDQTINILDLAFIGARFNKPTPWTGNDSWADINGDNAINILDLTLAGSNFGQTGPQTW